MSVSGCAYSADVTIRVFFFVMPKTAYEVLISDWSSDVCSSDLLRLQGLPLPDPLCRGADPDRQPGAAARHLRRLLQSPRHFRIGGRIGDRVPDPLDRKSVV